MKDIERVTKVETDKLGDLSTPVINDIDDATVEGDDKPISHYAVEKDSALERIFDEILETAKETIAGTNKVGKAGAIAKDYLKYTIPAGKELDALADHIGQEMRNNLKSQQNNNTMEQETIFKKIIRRIKQPSTQAALGLVATLLGSAWIGVDISVAELTNSAVGIVTGFAGVYTGAVSIYNMFVDDEKKGD